MESEQENSTGAHHAGARPFDTSPRVVACAIGDDEVEQMWLDLPIGIFTIIKIDAGPGLCVKQQPYCTSAGGVGTPCCEQML